MTHTSAAEIIQQARARSRLLLTEVEAKALRSVSGVAVAQARLAQTREEAVATLPELFAREAWRATLGFPLFSKFAHQMSSIKVMWVGSSSTLRLPKVSARRLMTL